MCHSARGRWGVGVGRYWDYSSNSQTLSPVCLWFSQPSEDGDIKYINESYARKRSGV